MDLIGHLFQSPAEMHNSLNHLKQITIQQLLETSSEEDPTILL